MKNLEQLYTKLTQDYSDENLRLRAREDAAKNIPRADLEESSPFEVELLNACQSLASAVAGEYRASLEELDGDIKADRETAESRHYDELNRIESIYLAKRQALDNDFDLKEARLYHEGALSRFNTMYGRVGRLPIEYLPGGLYALLAFLIFALEIPLNALVFKLSSENQLMSWIVATIMGFAIPLSGHFIGIKLREQFERISLANLLQGAVVFALNAGAVFGLSIMRRQYISELNESMWPTGVHVPNNLTFLGVNTAVLVVAVILSYLAHEPVPGYQPTFRDYARARKLLAKLERGRVNRLKGIETDKAYEIDYVKRNYREAIDEVNKLKGKYDRILKEGQEQEARCLYQLGRLVSVYRHENMSCREDKLVPKAFGRTLEFPLRLAGMSEKLINEED